MSVNEKFGQLEKEIKPFQHILGNAADTILDQEVSSYPIFVMHKKELNLGILIKGNDHEKDWAFNASTLEEFVAKRIISEDKLDNFKQVYKKPEEFLCLFLVEKVGATFVFIPRK